MRTKTASEADALAYLTVWEQGELGGNVAAEPSELFPVRCVGIERITHPAYSLGEREELGKTLRPLNRPVFISLALAERLFDRYAPQRFTPDSVDASALDRLKAGELVLTQSNAYQLEVQL